MIKNTPKGCIPNLINNKQSHCNIFDETIEDTIELIEPNYLVIISHTEVSLETTCSEKVRNKTLKGMVLIHFEDCNIKINNIEYSSKYAAFRESIQVISTLYNDMNVTEVTSNLTMKKLNKWTLENTEAINLLNLQNNTNYISIIGVILVIISIIAMMIRQGFKEIWKPKAQQIATEPAFVNNQSTSTVQLPPSQLSWPSLHT